MARVSAFCLFAVMRWLSSFRVGGQRIGKLAHNYVLYAHLLNIKCLIINNIKFKNGK